jgi:DNA-binding MarR family transcriptional regulator
MESTIREELIYTLMRFKQAAKPLPMGGDLRSAEIITLRYFAVSNCHKENRSQEASDVQHLRHILHISKPAVSQMLNGLEKKGYITRQIDANDRRRIEVAVTQSGMVVLEEAKIEVDLMMDRLIQRFGIEDMRQLIALLNRLVDTSEALKEEILAEREVEN